MNWVITDIQVIGVLCKVNQYSLAVGQPVTLMCGKNLYLYHCQKNVMLYLLMLSVALLSFLI